jgi:hypothetical protein
LNQDLLTKCTYSLNILWSRAGPTTKFIPTVRTYFHLEITLSHTPSRVIGTDEKLAWAILTSKLYNNNRWRSSIL